MRRRALLSVVLSAVATSATLGSPVALVAQAADPLIGKWSVEYEVGRRMENGEATGIRGKGTFTIMTSGDSLVVTIQAPARPDGSVPPPSTVGAHSTNGETTFIQKQKVRVNMNGEESMLDVELTWTLKASGDALTGTLARKMPDMPEMGAPSAVTGARLKA